MTLLVSVMTDCVFDIRLCKRRLLCTPARSLYVALSNLIVVNAEGWIHLGV